MFKRILLPTDGSELSLRAIDTGLELASSLHASVYAFHVIPPLPPPYFADIALPADGVLFEQTEAFANRCLDAVKQRAAAAGVGYDGGTAINQRPATAIVEAAQEQGCDLIVMASHGWRGVDRLLLGSETHKVIVQGMVPVLVVR